MSHRLLVKDQQGEREVILVDTLAVGRDPRCDLNSSDPLLSRRHAEFIASGPLVRVRDLNSRNGILVNGRRLVEAELHPGDVVQIAQLAVTFLSHVEAETQYAPIGVPGIVTTVPDDQTSLLTPAELLAVAAASGRRTQGNGGNTTDAADGEAAPNGSRKSAWSVQLVAEDDRTKLVPPPATPAGAVIDALPAKPVSSAATLGAIPAPSVEPQLPRAASEGASVRRSGVAARVTLAVGSFIAGVASTLIWLKAPASLAWLAQYTGLLAVAAAFVVVLGAGTLAGLVIGRRIGREKSD